MTNCVRRHALVGWLLSELDPDQSASIAAHVNECESCQKKVRAIKDNMDEYKAVSIDRYENIREQLWAARAEVERRRFRRRTTLYAVLSAAAVVTVLVLRFPIVYPGQSDRVADQKANQEEKIQYKGVLGVEVFAKRGERQFRAREGETLKQGDILRFVLTISEPGYVSIFSIDARGTVTPFYPDSSPQSDPHPYTIKSTGRQELPDAIELDDTSGEERIVIAFSPALFDRRVIHQQLVKAASQKNLEEKSIRTSLASGQIKILSFIKSDRGQ